MHFLDLTEVGGHVLDKTEVSSVENHDCAVSEAIGDVVLVG